MLPPTTIHHPTHRHPPPAKIYLPPPTTTHQEPQCIHHQPPLPKKMDYHPEKAKIYSYIAPSDIVLTVSFSSKCNISVMEILRNKNLISLFFKFKILTTFYILHLTFFEVYVSRVIFHVVIFNNKDFELLTAATFLLRHVIFFYHYLKKLHESIYQCYQIYYFFKMGLSNF